MAASFLGKLLVKIEGDNSDLDKSINKSEKTTKKFSKFAIAAYAAIGVATIALGKKAVKAFAVQEQAEARLNATIKSTGEAAGLTAKELIDMAQGLQEVTKFGDEAIIGAESLLLTFKDIGGDIFPRALESILDVSEAMGTGLKESSIQVGKALNDPIQGLTALRRVGIQFSDAQEELIKGFVKSNDLASAQGIILTELESQFGGVARAAGDTATGSLTQLNNIFGDLQESFGRSIAEGINPFVRGLTDVITQLVKARNKSLDLKEALDLQAEGQITSAEQTLLILENQRDKLGRIAAQYEGLDEEANTAWENAIRQVEDYNESLGITDTFLLRVTETEDRRTAIIDANSEALTVYVQILKDAMTDEELRLIFLQSEIDRLAELREEAKALGEDWGGIQTLINALSKEQVELLTEEVEIVGELEEAIIQVSDAEALRHAEGMIGIGREAEAIKELAIDYETLAQDGLGAFAAAFQMVGQEGVTAWDIVKQAGKDAISTFLQGLGKQAIIEAGLQFARPFGIGIPSGIRFTAASIAAFAAAGFVQNLAEGGVIAPATGGVPAVMAEAGVPEMAMPLTSSAINPFADAVANRISTTTNNNTQNFNSMFSLNDENKMREAARRLFPFLRDEEQRRGILV